MGEDLCQVKGDKERELNATKDIIIIDKIRMQNTDESSLPMFS